MSHRSTTQYNPRPRIRQQNPSVVYAVRQIVCLLLTIILKHLFIPNLPFLTLVHTLSPLVLSATLSLSLTISHSPWLFITPLSHSFSLTHISTPLMTTDTKDTKQINQIKVKLCFSSWLCVLMSPVLCWYQISLRLKGEESILLVNLETRISFKLCQETNSCLN